MLELKSVGQCIFNEVVIRGGSFSIIDTLNPKNILEFDASIDKKVRSVIVSIRVIMDGNNIDEFGNYLTFKYTYEKDDNCKYIINTQREDTNECSTRSINRILVYFNRKMLLNRIYSYLNRDLFEDFCTTYNYTDKKKIPVFPIISNAVRFGGDGKPDNVVWMIPDINHVYFTKGFMGIAIGNHYNEWINDRMAPKSIRYSNEKYRFGIITPGDECWTEDEYIQIPKYYEHLIYGDSISRQDLSIIEAVLSTIYDERIQHKKIITI